MDGEIDGREVWVVTIGTEPSWRLVGVYSTEGRAEAAMAHLRQSTAGTAGRAAVVKVRIDEELVGLRGDEAPTGPLAS